MGIRGRLATVAALVLVVASCMERQATPKQKVDLRGLDKKLSITRESFTLRDQDGNAYPCVEPKELIENYQYLDLDRRLAELSEIVFNRFAAFVQYPSKFSPTRGMPDNALDSTIVRDAVGLPQFGFIIDYIYFPRPKTGVMGKRFELFLKTPELQDAVFVKFAVL